jgi:hypothetical protein
MERSFSADTRAGMARAHDDRPFIVLAETKFKYLMAWFNVNGTPQISPRSPDSSNPKLV